MRFEARIRTADGGERRVQFDSTFDATAVLEDQVKREHLRPGETLILERARDQRDALKHDRDLKAMVPAIHRIQT